MFFVHSEEIRRPRPEINVKTVSGTQKMHSVVGVSHDILKTRRLSCFCQECLNGDPDKCEQTLYVDEWKTICLKYIKPPVVQEEHSSNDLDICSGFDDHRLVDQEIEQEGDQSCGDIDQPSCQSNKLLSGKRKENEERFGKERRKWDTLDQIDAKYHNHERQPVIKTVERNQHIRKKYFSDLIDSLHGCKSFEELQTISKSESAFIDERFPLLLDGNIFLTESLSGILSGKNPNIMSDKNPGYMYFA
ncbi:uncharacterized protein LOC125647372 [Ostrea edulis]|uniref:uncharacterized protein LOC125647372 n=1 Tax=Ostrea edulis TaxID=37623 RepID=UPI0024AF78F5|nr:uncharacterized protein LOC125647372 [Ostrea edulis]